MKNYQVLLIWAALMLGPVGWFAWHDWIDDVRSTAYSDGFKHGLEMKKMIDIAMPDIDAGIGGE